MIKKSRFLPILIFITINSFAQQTSFFRTFSSFRQIKFWNVETTHDDGYVLCGSIYNFNGGDFIILKTDSNGNEEWRYTNNQFNGTDYDNNAYKVKETPDKGFIIVGTITNSNNIDNLIYAKFDSTGALVWKNNLNIPGAGSGYAAFDILIRKDSSCIFVFNKYSSTLVTKLNFYSGDTSWIKQVSISSNSFLPHQIIELNNSLYIFGISDSLGQNFQWNSIVNTDTLGNFLWYKKIQDTVSTLFSCDYKISSDSSFLGLSINRNLPNNPIFRINKINLLGNVDYQKSFLQKIPNNSGTILNDSTIAFPAKGSIAHDSINIWQANFFNNSYFLRGGFYAWDNFSTNTIVDRKYRIINCGYIDPGQSSIGFLLRTSDSTSTFGIEKMYPDEFFNVYPNPSINSATIELNNNFLKSNHFFALRIFDNIGKLVYEENYSHFNIVKINTEKLKSGIYLFNILGDNSSITGKFIVCK